MTYTVALTGGIGSGKSTVADALHSSALTLLMLTLSRARWWSPVHRG